MAPLRRLVSSTLLLVGILLVLVGFSTALGFTVGGVLASFAAIGTLLYAGGVWFGGSPAPPPPITDAAAPIVFDRRGTIIAGPSVGQSVAILFPELARPEIERRSAAALAGTSARFPCSYHGRIVLIEALPVRSADGTVVCGILMTADGRPAAVAALA